MAILRERSIHYHPNEKMPRLVKQVASALQLIPEGVAAEARATETVKRLLSNLGGVADGLAELRNLHGTGHGKEADSKGLALHHARLQSLQRLPWRFSFSKPIGRTLDNLPMNIGSKGFMCCPAGLRSANGTRD